MKKKIVFVAMSGGVDSSVAAGLLKRQGFALRGSQGNPERAERVALRGSQGNPERAERVDVVGVFMKNWSSESSGVPGDYCSAVYDFESAAKAATALDIPLYVWNFEKEYKEQVFEYMLREYLAGRTPNPDAMCNKEIKFGVFFKAALEAGADFVATGHYARVREIKNQNSPPKADPPLAEKVKSYELLAGIDENKDQSYFLWMLTQEHLARTLFPIGEYTKPQVRKLARKFGLPNAERRDSQGLCFVGKVNFQGFLKEYLPAKKGLVVTTSGETLGEHDGAHYYTIGQRHGLGFAAPPREASLAHSQNGRGGGMPYYVAAKDTKSNTLLVASGRDNPALFRQELEIRDLNWISGVEPELPFRCRARIRYRQPLQACRVERSGEKTPSSKLQVPSSKFQAPSSNLQALHVIFEEPQWAVAPGQSIVFYKGDEVLGGGVIV